MSVGRGPVGWILTGELQSPIFPADDGVTARSKTGSPQFLSTPGGDPTTDERFDCCTETLGTIGRGDGGGVPPTDLVCRAVVLRFKQMAQLAVMF